MKTLLTLFIIFTYQYCFSQEGDIITCASPLQCAANNAVAYFTDADIDSLTYSYANPDSIPTNFHDVHYNQEATCQPNVKKCLQDTSQLKYEVYYPKPGKFNYATCKLQCYC